jgi:hypothetical protein
MTLESASPTATVETEMRQTAAPREFSGTKLIIGLFLFATILSSGLWIYWYLHTRPFQSLQLAIHQAFPKSYPQVQGGQRRMHQQTPRVLRITLRVDFDPNPDLQTSTADERTDADRRVEALVDQLAQLARQHVDLDAYDLLEVHLFQRRPEHKSQTRTVVRELRALPSRK